MELKEFIKATINDICDGIFEARMEQGAKYDNNAVVAPGNINGSEIDLKNIIRDISFEVQIEIKENQQKKGGAKLSVISGNIEKNKEQNNLSKISFSVPFLPAALSTYNKRNNG